jgi:transposase
MATKGKGNSENVAEETADRIRDLNERIIEAGRKAGNAYLDGYEKTLRSIADYEERMADSSQVEWLSTLLNAQADFTREIAKAATASAREFLK